MILNYKLRIQYYTVNIVLICYIKERNKGNIYLNNILTILMKVK